LKASAFGTANTEPVARSRDIACRSIRRSHKFQNPRIRELPNSNPVDGALKRSGTIGTGVPPAPRRRCTRFKKPIEENKAEKIKLNSQKANIQWRIP
jgi:hypothetical protein